MKRTSVIQKTAAVLLSAAVLHFSCLAAQADETGLVRSAGSERSSSPSAAPVKATVGDPFSRGGLKPRFSWRGGRLVVSDPALANLAEGRSMEGIPFAFEPAARGAALAPGVFAAAAAIPQADKTTTRGQKILAFIILGAAGAAAVALVVNSTNDEDPVLGAGTPTRVVP